MNEGNLIKIVINVSAVLGLSLNKRKASDMTYLAYLRGRHNPLELYK